MPSANKTKGEIIKCIQEQIKVKLEQIQELSFIPDKGNQDHATVKNVNLQEYWMVSLTVQSQENLM